MMCCVLAASYHDRSSAAVVRTMDGRLQHLQVNHLAEGSPRSRRFPVTGCNLLTTLDMMFIAIVVDECGVNP